MKHSSRYGEMSRKDFVAIASSLGAIHDAARRHEETSRMIPVLKKSNPRFDESRFRAAVERAAGAGSAGAGFGSFIESGMMKLGLRRRWSARRNSRGRFTR